MTDDHENGRQCQPMMISGACRRGLRLLGRRTSRNSSIGRGTPFQLLVLGSHRDLSLRRVLFPIPTRSRVAAASGRGTAGPKACRASQPGSQMTAGKYEDHQRQGNPQHEVEPRVGPVKSRMSLQRSAHDEVHLTVSDDDVISGLSGSSIRPIDTVGYEDAEVVDEKSRDIERRAHG